MKRCALHLEHKFKSRLISRKVVEKGRRPYVIGHARDVDLRLLGERIGPIHALIEFDQANWKLVDLGSEHGTWIDQEAISEHDLKSATVVHIGHHEIRMTPLEYERPVFNSRMSPHQAVDDMDESHRTWFHQIVIKKRGVVKETRLLPAQDEFAMRVEGELVTLRPPESGRWVDVKRGDYHFRHRLVQSQIVDDSLRGRIEGLHRDSPRAFALAGLVILFLLSVLMFAPRPPDGALKTVDPMQNKYTQIIFDAEKIKKSRDESQKLKKHLMGQSQIGEIKSTPGGDAGRTQPSEVSPVATKVISNLKSAGLSQLIGKISKRAAQNVVFVPSAGVSPDEVGSGRALGAGSSLVGSDSQNLAGLQGGEGQSVGKVGTAGRGGGSSSYMGSGALSRGNVGNAEVGILEEETIVEGGLDREIIARVIKSYLGQIRYCYERQLSANPDLYGKVLVRFTIGANGAVTSQTIGTSSLKNSMVEGCILRRVASWQFPTPKGGTHVLVSYPFLFKSTR